MTEDTANEFSLHDKCILLIDDEEVIREIGSEMIEALGMTCLTAATGENGLDLFREHRERISAVILDIELPGLTGEKIYGALKKIDPEVKVLFASGYGKDYLEARYFDKHKLAHFLPKPFQLGQLRNKLLQVIQS